MTVTDGLLACAGRVDCIERQGDFNEFSAQDILSSDDHAGERGIIDPIQPLEEDIRQGFIRVNR